MATVLAYTSPAKGHLFPAAAILLELRRRGHRIALRTLASEVPAMRELGFDAAPLDARIAAIEPPVTGPRGTVAALRASIKVFAQRAGTRSPTSAGRSMSISPTRSSST
jgi:UDP:flavonoid glycosyltransferase YjiC (YdhE family)